MPCQKRMSYKISLQSILSFFALSLGALLLFGCSAKKEDTGKVFHSALLDTPGSLDPQNSVGGEWEAQLFIDIYGGLFFTDEAGEPTPLLLEGYEASEDGLTYTFHLKKNLKWSDGEPFTTEDVLFSFHRLAGQTGAYSDFWSGKVIGYEEVVKGEKKAEEMGMEALDPYTFVIHLTKPAPYLPAALSMSLISPILPKHHLEKYGKDWTHHYPIPSINAFYISEFYPDDHVVTKKNPYFIEADKVYYDTIVYDIIPDPQTAYARFVNHEISYYSGCLLRNKPEMLKRLDASEIVTAPKLSVYFYAFNYDRGDGLYKDERVRQAINMAIDRQTIIDNVNPGVMPAYSMVPPLTAGFSKKTPYRPDYASLPMEERIQKAQALMKAAGFSETHRAKITLSYNTLEAHKTDSSGGDGDAQKHLY